MMDLKFIGKCCVLVGLLSCSFSAFALSEKIKCPSSDFVKSTYSGTLYRVTRYDEERDHRIEYDVDSNYSYYDNASKLEWVMHIFVNTSHDYDFNEAFKNAQYALANIVKVENDNAVENRIYAECQYLDKDGKPSLILVAEKDNKLKHRMK